MDVITTLTHQQHDNRKEKKSIQSNKSKFRRKPTCMYELKGSRNLLSIRKKGEKGFLINIIVSSDNYVPPLSILVWQVHGSGVH